MQHFRAKPTVSSVRENEAEEKDTTRKNFEEPEEGEK
jgi:hypothetical protein